MSLFEFLFSAIIIDFKTNKHIVLCISTSEIL